MSRFSDLTSPEAVQKAIEEFDRIGRNAFLGKYSFGPAKSYYLEIDGRLYDSKPIVGAAYGFQFPRQGPLGPGDFAGGEATVKRKLEKLGFQVRVVWNTSEETPLVLVENELTEGGRYDDWKDVTGERYHFPNKYRNFLLPGRPFVYYRGVRRQSGTRGPAEYFGVGRIGPVYPDSEVPDDTPKKNWKWYAEVNEYLPFPKPVPAKIGGELLEKIPKNFWGVAVRRLPQEVFERILALSGMGSGFVAKIDVPTMVPIEEVAPILLGETESLLTESRRPKSRAAAAKGGSRRSPYAKILGDRGEEIVRKYLLGNLPPSSVKTLEWVARSGATPGYDIKYVDEHGNLVAIEVKATSGPKFPSIEITAGEWETAKKLKGHYWLYLVADCLTGEPKISCIQNPAELVTNGAILATPTHWELTRHV